MKTTPEPRAMREIHEIRERLHKERKGWTAAQRRQHHERIAEQAAKRGLRVLPHVNHRLETKPL